MKLPRLSPLTANQRRFLLILLCTVPAVALYYGLPRMEDLSPDIPLSERERMIADGRARLARSGWALYILLPVLFTLLIDTVILFLLPDWSLFL